MVRKHANETQEISGRTVNASISGVLAEFPEGPRAAERVSVKLPDDPDFYAEAIVCYAVRQPPGHFLVGMRLVDKQGAWLVEPGTVRTPIEYADSENDG